MRRGWGEVFKADRLKHAMHPGKGDWIPTLRAQGSTAGVTPQSARVRAKAPRQAGLTFSINSHCLSHNTPPLNRKTARRNAEKENKEKKGGGWRQIFSKILCVKERRGEKNHMKI